MTTLFKSQKGFVILLAIVISASILMIGAGIFGSAFKQTILASTSTESQIALFVADTGMECALFAEFVNGGVIEMCAGKIVQDSQITQLGNTTITNTLVLSSYEFIYELPGTPGCGKVTVQRNTTQSGESGGTGTSIIARGYNFCTQNPLSPDTNNSTLVERRLEVWYPNTVPEPTTVGVNPVSGLGAANSPAINPLSPGGTLLPSVTPKQ
jgi:hypothetical protein